MTPLHNNVLLKLIKEDAVQNGVIIPDNAKEQPTRGEVIAVGPGRYENGILIVSSLQAGDIVMFPTWAGSFQKITLPGQDKDMEYAIIKDTDIMGILQTKE